MIWKPRVAPGPFLFHILQGVQSRAPMLANPFEEMQRLAQVTEFVHHKNLREKDMPHGPELRPALQPVRELPAARRRDFVHQAPRPALRTGAARTQPARFLHALERGINLAQLRGPEMADAAVDRGLQVVAARGFAEQAEQNVFQAHARTI
jgi:hypothetical protein